MKKISLLAIMAVVSLGIVFTSCDSKKSIGSAKLTSEVDSISYIIGKASAYNMMKNTKMQMESWPEKGNYEAFVAGVNDCMENPDDSLFLGKDMASLNEYVNGFFTRLQQKISTNNLEEGVKFLAENKAKSGVITTESGLQYKVITEGTGPKPKPEDVVRVNYRGTYLDGTEFDSSERQGGPAEFPVGRVIAGWTEAIQIMPVGSKYTLWIPTELAYGAQPQSPQIQPNAMLIFDVELLEIVQQ